MTAPVVVTPVLCTDENVAIRASDDYLSLCPTSNVLASGADGVIALGSPWTLTSVSVDFAANGVGSQNVVHLSGGSPKVAGTGQLFAVDSASGHSVVLRRLGLPLNFGQTPGLATGLTFRVLTFAPQIEEVTFDLYRRFGVDSFTQTRSVDWITDLRDLRRLCVLETLLDRYTSANRTKEGDWAMKINQLQEELGELRGRTSLRWGPRGDADIPTGRFTGTVIR